MRDALRIGTQIWPDDPFWVQVREAIHLRAEQLGVELVPIEREALERLTPETQLDVLEELLALDLHALIGWSLNDVLVSEVLAANLPVIHLGESAVRHTRFTAPLGLYRMAYDLGRFIADRQAAPGLVLVVGGGQGHGEDGRSRIAGFRAALAERSDLTLFHIPTPWRYEQAYPQIVAALADQPLAPVAVFGFSDSLTLAARDALAALQRPPVPLLVGINGDPLALAAIAEGSMTATILTSAVAFGAQALDLALQAARGAALPERFSYQPQLVTAENITAVAAQQLFATAPLTNRLVGFSRQQEQRRLSQFETSLEISRRAGLIMERQRLGYLIADLIRSTYGYAEVQLLRWDAERRMLWYEPTDVQHVRGAPMMVERSPVLDTVLSQNQPVFLPDVQHSRRFAIDPAYPDIRARVVVPIRLGGQITGLLDLHSYQTNQHTHHDLVGLQTLADQLAIAVRNAELYEQALTAQRRAEQADELKTRLLANVSHELRTPLNLILGYSQTALTAVGGPEAPDRALLERDLQHIYQSGEHLIRLINDLLDLSRATIGALELFPEPIAPRRFLEELFHTVADQAATPDVLWHLELPARLPLIHADPVRLRQVVLNLLDNARKFTPQGRITLGAEVQVPYLHFWVRDTGAGIAPEQQERIFESFVSEPGAGRHEGIGLGLTIARQLVALHGGSITLESRVGQGTTFHVYLPLPNLSGRTLPPLITDRPTLLLIAADVKPHMAISEICRRQGLGLRAITARADLVQALAETQPVALAWNLAFNAPTAWELFQQIRAQPQLFHVPVIVYYQEAEQRAVPDLGLTSVLLKPLAAARLVEAIEQVRPQMTAGTILIVDDDQEAHALYRRLITAQLPGYVVRSAYDGRQGLAMIAETTPSLVILDLIMPDVDGFAVLDALRAQPATQAVPVLVISGRMLTADDIQRLDRARVVVHSKAVLTDADAAHVIERALAPHDLLPQQTSSLVKHAVAYIHQNYQLPLTRQEIADAIGVNKDYLSRIFRRELGVSPWDYLNRYRIAQARELLRSTHASIAAIGADVGFSDPAYFSRVFHKEAGCSPREYRETSTSP
jgi:signal transduction histidine kinase/AraC-like DNA-binding protein/ABC-type sugar transport system substrate-binding protein/DNA-binding response OmpR family regulator